MSSSSDSDDRLPDPSAIVARFASQLAVLARRRIWGRLQSRIDPDDVVQSAFGTFFRRLNDGEFPDLLPNDLWRLLATITINKVHRQQERHLAERRSIRREVAWSGMWEGLQVNAETLSRPPTDIEALALVEELEVVLGQLEPVQREIIGWKLEGASHAEIAARLDRTDRTVRRALEQARELLQSRLQRD